MDITVIEESNSQEYDEVLSLFSASPFISAPWIEAFRTSHRIPIYFRFVAERQTIGAIAGLVLEPSYNILRKLNRSIFFFSGPAVLQADEDLIRACIQSLIHHVTINGYTGLQFKSYDYPHGYDLGDMTFYKESTEEFIIDLGGEFAEIEKNMRRRVKELVRQASRTGLTFHESHSQQIIEDLIFLLEETRSVRRSKGYENYSYFYMPYFDKEIIYKLFQNKIARIFYVKHQDKIVYVKLLVTHDTKACALLVGTNREGYKLKAPAFTWFNTIKKLKEDGIGSYNVGGVANDSGASGLVFFKTSFGAKKHACVGGWTPFLQGPVLNLLYQIYYKKFSIATIKKIFGRVGFLE